MTPKIKYCVVPNFSIFPSHVAAMKIPLFGDSQALMG